MPASRLSAVSECRHGLSEQTSARSGLASRRLAHCLRSPGPLEHVSAPAQQSTRPEAGVTVDPHRSRAFIGRKVAGGSPNFTMSECSSPIHLMAR